MGNDGHGVGEYALQCPYTPVTCVIGHRGQSSRENVSTL